MSVLEVYKKQHEEILHSASRILAQIHHPDDSFAEEVAKFLGRITVHVTMEDETLYPELMEHNNKAIRAAVTELQNELGTLQTFARLFRHRWSDAQAIQLQPEEFRKDTRDLVEFVVRRIKLEDQAIYGAFNAVSS